MYLLKKKCIETKNQVLKDMSAFWKGLKDTSYFNTFCEKLMG